MSVFDIEQAIKSISDRKKYHISKNHAETNENLLFPIRFDGGCSRSFRRTWLNIFPWLVYSGTAAGALCEVSSVFAKSRKNQVLLLINHF